MQSNDANVNSQSYFDLHIQGIGYLNRVREVPVRKGPGYLSCTIAALRGADNEIEKTYLDCRVVGREAMEVVRRFAKDSEQHKVLIGFKAGDLWLERFTYRPPSPKAGQAGASLKARLLMISWVKLDGQSVWSRPANSATDEEFSSDQSSAEICQQAVG